MKLPQIMQVGSEYSMLLCGSTRTLVKASGIKVTQQFPTTGALKAPGDAFV